jgi:hypothetical protein
VSFSIIILTEINYGLSGNFDNDLFYEVASKKRFHINVKFN